MVSAHKVQVRPALPDDAAQIAALQVASWREAYRGILSDTYLERDIVSERSALWTQRFESTSPDQFVVVAEVEREIVGFACAYAGVDDQCGTLLDNIHVSSGYQGKGVGTNLVGAVAHWCSLTSPHPGLFLWVLQSNVRAHRFYERLGAVRTDTDVWAPPGGGAIARYRYSWPGIDRLRKNLADLLGTQPA